VKSTTRLALALVPLAFLGLFFVYPVVAILLRGLSVDGRWQLGAFTDVLGDPVMRQVAWFTLWQAVVSTTLTLVAGLPAAYCFARLEFRGKRLLWAALIVPFVLPTVVVASAFLGVVGPGGPLGVDLRGTIWAILIAHVFFNYAVVVRTVGAFWSQLDPALEDSARMLGASRWRAFREVTLPLLRPAIAAAASIVFLFTFTSFGVVLLLGGPQHHTLEVEIYHQTARLLNLDTAAVLAIVQLVAVAAVLIWYARQQERRAVALQLRPAAETSRRPTTLVDKAMLAGNGLVMATLLGVPLGVLAARSFDTPDGFGLASYRALETSRRGSVLFVSPLEAIRNSLLFASAATVVAIVVGGLAAYAIAGGRRTDRTGGPMRWIDTALMLPLGVSAVTVGFGFLIALDRPPVDLRESVALVPIAHALVAVPFVIRIVVPVLRSIDPAAREAASVLGASPPRVWWEVDAPVLGRSVVVAAGFAFAVSLGEFGATVFLARADWPTLPIAIFRFLGQPGPLNFGQAMALSTILMAVTVVVALAMERLRGARSAGEF
jgi:thiamine transport system permease protein